MGTDPSRSIMDVHEASAPACHLGLDAPGEHLLLESKRNMLRVTQ